MGKTISVIYQVILCNPFWDAEFMWPELNGDVDDLQIVDKKGHELKPLNHLDVE